MATKTIVAGDTATAEQDAETNLLDVQTAAVKRLVARGKAKPKVATAIARELTGFIWAIAQEVSPAPP